MRRKSGFTMIEIMIALAIIGILAMAAGTNWQMWTNKSNASFYFRDVFMQASLGKTMAMASRRQHSLRIVFAAGTVTIMQGNASSGSNTWSNVRDSVIPPRGSICRIDSVIKTLNGVDQAAVTTGTEDIVFNPSGDGFPFDQIRIRMTGPNGARSQVRIYGWTAKARLENVWS